jgi:protein TonB
MKVRFIATIASAVLVFAGSSVSASPQSSAWEKKVRSLVAAKQSYPRAAVMRGVEGGAVLRVFIGTKGEFVSTTIVKSTGSSLLDREALKLPEKVGTFPAPPSGVKSIDLPIVWKLL